MSKYIFTKDSKFERPRGVSEDTFISASYGESFIYEPIDVPLRIYHFSGSPVPQQNYKLIHSLKNTINYYSANDDLFNYDSIIQNPFTLYTFSSNHLGSGFERGSVKLTIYYSGSILSTVSDFREDGVLYTENDEKAGLILYNEGFLIINHTSSLNSDSLVFNANETSFEDNPRWIHAFLDSEKPLYYDIEYNVKNSTPVSTFFIHLNKNEFNHSNNSTYIESGSYFANSGSYFFKENEEISIKNTIKSPFVSGSSNFEKQTFISKIGLYDKDKKLIGVASLANPVRKTENREFTFKIKVDW